MWNLFWRFWWKREKCLVMSSCRPALSMRKNSKWIGYQIWKWFLKHGGVWSSRNIPTVLHYECVLVILRFSATCLLSCSWFQSGFQNEIILALNPSIWPSWVLSSQTSRDKQSDTVPDGHLQMAAIRILSERSSQVVEVHQHAALFKVLYFNVNVASFFFQHRAQTWKLLHHKDVLYAGFYFLHKTVSSRA